jgi:hypothetical protein
LVQGAIGSRERLGGDVLEAAAVIGEGRVGFEWRTIGILFISIDCAGFFAARILINEVLINSLFAMTCDYCRPWWKWVHAFYAAFQCCRFL